MLKIQTSVSWEELNTNICLALKWYIPDMTKVQAALVGTKCLLLRYYMSLLVIVREFW
jgi:hypothetical protein